MGVLTKPLLFIHFLVFVVSVCVLNKSRKKEGGISGRGEASSKERKNEGTEERLAVESENSETLGLLSMLEHSVVGISLTGRKHIQCPLFYVLGTTISELQINISIAPVFRCGN